MPRQKGPSTKRIAPVFYLDEHAAIGRAARRAGVSPPEFIKAAAMRQIADESVKAA